MGNEISSDTNGLLGFDPYPATMAADQGQLYGPPTALGSMSGESGFPVSDIRTSGLSNLFNSGQNNQNTVQSVMGSIGGGIQDDPVLKRYFDLAAQGPPRREDNQPGFWSRLGMGLIGGAQALYDPKGAIGTVDSLVNEKYNLAAGQYNQDLKVASDAAKNEETLLNTGSGIFGHIAQQENYANLANNRGGRLDFDYTKLGQTGSIADRRLAIQDAAQKADAAYKAGSISVQERNSTINAARLALSQLMSGSQIDLNNARTNRLNNPIEGSRGTGPMVNRPNAANENRLQENEYRGDPLVSKYYIPGQGVLQQIRNDPAAWERYQMIARKYAGLPEEIEPFDPNTLGFNTGGLP